MITIFPVQVCADDSWSLTVIWSHVITLLRFEMCATLFKAYALYFPHQQMKGMKIDFDF